MAKKKAEVEATLPAPTTESSSAELLKTLVQALEATKPFRKKTAYERKPINAWTPKDGSVKSKLKRKFFQHGLPVDAEMSTSHQIDLMNQVKPGRYLDGYVRVVRRRDKGVDIDYPIKTAAQRMRLSAQFNINSFDALLERCIEEANNPTKYAIQDED